jgi:putative membrane protein
MRMRLTTAAVVLMGSLTAIAAHADDKGKSEMFIKEAIQGNIGEQKIGQLAQQKGATEGVRKFGKDLEHDHAKANDSAMTVAKSIGVNPPEMPTKKQRELYDRLSKLSGEQFDKEFVQAMVKDHKKDIQKYSEEAKGTGPVDMYAKDTLPHLKQHLQEAESLQGNMQASDQ